MAYQEPPAPEGWIKSGNTWLSLDAIQTFETTMYNGELHVSNINGKDISSEGWPKLTDLLEALYAHAGWKARRGAESRLESKFLSDVVSTEYPNSLQPEFEISLEGAKDVIAFISNPANRANKQAIQIIRAMRINPYK